MKHTCITLYAVEREQKTWDFRKSPPVLKLTPVKEKETNPFNNQKYLADWC